MKPRPNRGLVARTPEKLRTLLEQQHNVPSNILDTQLTIIQGSVKDIAPVKETLAPGNSPASIIVSGLGSAPKLVFRLKLVEMVDPKLVEEGVTVILQALRELRRDGTISAAQKPLLCTISTTGISETEDVPCLFRPGYHWGLAEAHKDKKIAERLVASAAMETGDDAPLSGFVIPRASLLNDGASKGMEHIRVGWEKHPAALAAVEEEATGPAIGYFISRADVGLWIFEEVIKGGNKWSGKCVTLTH